MPVRSVHCMGVLSVLCCACVLCAAACILLPASAMDFVHAFMALLKPDTEAEERALADKESVSGECLWSNPCYEHGCVARYPVSVWRWCVLARDCALLGAQAVLSVTPTLIPDMMFHDLVFGRDLGTGSFSCVRYAKHIIRGKSASLWPEYAVKVISTEMIRSLGATALLRCGQPSTCASPLPPLLPCLMTAGA
jgi:hypothetical protein